VDIAGLPTNLPAMHWWGEWMTGVGTATARWAGAGD